VGTGIKRYRKWKVETPLSPLPLPPEWETWVQLLARQPAWIWLSDAGCVQNPLVSS